MKAHAILLSLSLALPLAAERDFLTADAWVLASKPDSARAILERLAAQFPDNPRIRDRLSKVPR